MAGKSTLSSKKSERAHIHITGMTCTTCAATIQKGLVETPGLKQANVTFAPQKFDEKGRLLDEKARELVRKLLHNLVNWARKLKTA
jgi:copper chaperone CopZ